VKPRVAVAGAGAFGKNHLRVIHQSEHAELAGVYDLDPARAAAVAEPHGCRVFRSLDELAQNADAAVIASPTVTHSEVGCKLMEAGIDVMVEKPIAHTLEAAQALVDTAGRHQRIMQVGHLERFNAAILAAEPYLRSPRFVECQRLASYRERGTDVNVVLDLMIHDIDIVQTIVGAPIVSIDAVGTPVFSAEIDIANARIRFANGCVANATASRVSLKTERKMRIFEDDAYISLDLQQKILTLIRKRTEADGPGPLPVAIEEQSLEPGYALKAEIEAFLECIRTKRAPVVTGEAGLMALETAHRITEQVEKALAERRAAASGG
jgi:predicted dehydrogenase